MTEETSVRVDLDAIQRRLDGANEECGPWSITPDSCGIALDALGDGGQPQDGTALFLREVREDIANLVAELRDAREVVAAARTQYGPRASLRIALEDYDGRWGS